VLKGILDALGIVAATSPLVPPAHPRTAARLDILDVPPGVQLVEPLGYLDLLAL
jgi:UDP-N-acetylglucosamine 2-epimerase (non-hydrolysing)